MAMLGAAEVVQVATGQSTITSVAGRELLSANISGGTASAAATFTVQNGATSATNSFVIAAAANTSNSRRFVAGVTLTQLTASVAANAACDVELA